MRYNANRLFQAVLASCVLAAVGGSQLFGQGGLSLDFNNENDPVLAQILFSGTAEFIPDGGVDNTGYLKVTDANNGESGKIILPDLSDPPGTALTSFQITADLRVGAGTERPADGFSFNLVRPDDPLLEDGAYAASPANEANLPEEGSQTGLGIGFDEWQSGGVDPAATETDCGSVEFDCIGISVRVDNELIAQAPFPILNAAPNDANYLQSLQTGPRGSVEDLEWATLVIQVTPSATAPDTEKNLFISYKDVEVINQSIVYQTSPGQLIFGGRTGGANSNHHIDNISIITDFTGGTPGDINGDGLADFADFLVLTSNMNKQGIDIVLGDGDLDFNRRVDLADFIIFRRAFQRANPAEGAASAVPEPNTGLLALAGLLGLGAFRRRR